MQSTSMRNAQMIAEQAIRLASEITILGPQEQYFGLVHYSSLASLRIAGLRIGGHFVECKVSNAHFMYTLDDFTLIGVR